MNATRDEAALWEEFGTEPADPAAVAEALPTVVVPEPEEPQLEPGAARKRSKPEPLAGAAYHGLAGEWAHLIEPHTEAHPAAIITTYLVHAGNAWGRAPYFEVAPGSFHRTNAMAAICGDSALGAKGDSKNVARMPFRVADPEWLDKRTFNAVNSTAGLIDLVRDPAPAVNPEGKPDPGCPDPLKRVIFILTELASLVRKFETKGDTLSSTYRDAWDGEPLMNTSKMNRASAQTHHISSIAHVTPVELKLYVTQTEQVNGFLNRHWFVWSERTKLVPSHTAPDALDVHEHARRLRQAIEWGKQAGRMNRDAAAEALWRHVYERLVTPPVGLASLLARARPHVVRISMIYAVLDCSVVIRVDHLLAALALWDYIAASYAYVFGGSGCDPRSTKLLDAVHGLGGRALHRDVHDALGRHWKQDDYRLAVEYLVGAGLLTTEEAKTAGRTGTLYVTKTSATYVPILPAALAFVAGQGHS